MPRDQITGVYGPYRQQISKNSTKYRVELRGSHGRRRIKSFPDRAAAEEFAEKIRSALDPGRRVDMIVDRFEEHMREKGNKARSINTAIKRLWSWLDPRSVISEITPSQISKIYERRCSDTAVDTHRNELNQVKTFFRFCVKKKILAVSPASEIEPIGKRKTRKEQLRIDEARTWTRAAQELATTGTTPQRAGALAAMIALYLGPRTIEIVSRRVRDIDDDCKLFWIPSSKTPSGRRIVEIPLNLQPFFKQQIKGKQSNDFLFSSPLSGTGHRTPAWVLGWVQDICNRAQVPVVTAHSMRGLHATIAEEHGISGHAVAQNLGHKNQTITHNHYTAPGTVERVTAKRAAKILGSLTENGRTQH